MNVRIKFAALAVPLVVAIPPLLSHEVVSTTVTFDREIVRILAKKCIACHSERNLGMPLTSYEQTRPWARSIEEEVLRRHMPPWRAVAGYGQFANDIGMSNREIQFIVAWVEGNGPRTKGEQVIANFGEAGKADDRLVPDFGRWQLGKPDLQMPLAAHSVDSSRVASGGDEVRREIIKLGLTSDAWVRALEFHPGDRRVVRAAYFSLQETGQWLGSWTPWYGVTTLPSNTAYRVPAGSHVIAELHYRSTDEVVEDRSTLGLYLTAKAANRPVDVVVETKAEGALDGRTQKVSGSVRLAADAHLLAFKPEVPPGIESMDVTARKPDGTVQVLLVVRHVLAEWPTPYILAQPVPLPKNTELAVNGYYDQAAAITRESLKLTVSLYNNAAPTAPRRR
jgi:hypothetical protein